ncbi:MAG TPA: Gfo/Idh/MocA family oxidoreductase [bacterium]|nr:Gfo/Idh/MocA family oxidoreductase [bacterium]
MVGAVAVCAGSVQQPVRLAVIGCGVHSVTSLQPCIPLIPAFEYVAACDRHPERAALGLRFGARRWYQDVARMFADEAIDAAIVAGPAAMNYEMGLACAEAGVHLFVEKPMAPTVNAARQLADAVRARGRVGMVGTMWRHAPAIGVQKKLVESPAFGRAVAFHGTHLAPGEFATGPGGRGGGSLGWRFMLDQGCHMADCTRFLMGPVRCVTAATSTTSTRRDQFGLSALLVFAGGATGTLLFASHASVMSPSVTVVGEAGQAVTVRHLVSLERHPLPDDLGDPALRARVTQTWAHGANYRGVSRPGHLEALEHFARAINTGAAPAPSLDDGWRALRLCQAMLESAEGGRSVPLASGE